MAKGRVTSRSRKTQPVKGRGKHVAVSPLLPTRRPAIRARYDAAQTTNDNRRHWANADALSADAANSPAVRNHLRQRSRYECDNNTYARGMIETLANDTIGTGPRLQIRGLPSKETAREIEAAFRDWCRVVGLTDALRVMRKSKAVSGEVFLIKVFNGRLPSPVKLDIQVIEADQCASPNQTLDNPVDGIELDPFQRPRLYHFLKEHPGGSSISTGINDTFKALAEDVLHYFRKDRPGQHRGIPEITAALPLFAQLRRYTLAVIAAAETAADFAGVLQSEASPHTGEAPEGEEWETVELEQRMLTVLPKGYTLGQIKAEQPVNTYKDFKAEILNEIARCLNMPFNIAAGNSSGYNYSSGRLDHQTYYKSIDVERSTIEDTILGPLFATWLGEAIERRALSREALSQLEKVNDRPNVQWFWDGMKHVDPAKEATAEATRLTSNTTTLARVFAEQGLDWEEELEQRGKELELMNKLGITPAMPAPAANTSKTPVEDDEEGADDEA